MGRLGYQSDAQASLAVSYNSLEQYADSLHDALTRPWPAYQALGVINPGGDYIQLATSLLQIENEFYGTIRPKRTIHQGERPLHALRERGVEYVEVRLLDLNPFMPVGIDAATMRFLDVFLLHCLRTPSAPDTPAEIRDLAHNQHLTAARGREPGLLLRRGGREVPLVDWAREILSQCEPLARELDGAFATTGHTDALVSAQAALDQPDLLPSARVLAALQQEHGSSFLRFVQACSLRTRQALLAQPWTPQQQVRYERMAQKSQADQLEVEAADSLPFEQFRQTYVSAERLVPRRARVVAN